MLAYPSVPPPMGDQSVKQIIYHVKSWYGDIVLRNPGITKSFITWIPRRCTLTGEWIWFDFVTKVVARTNHYDSMVLDKLWAKHDSYYFKPENWLIVVMSRQ
jgi:cytochrome c-type biogenesis protein CcmH/NrfF